MVGAGLAIAAMGVLGGYAVLLRQSGSRPGAGPVPLGAFPLALLVLIAPVPLVALQSIRDFQALASSGHADMKNAAGLALGILRPLSFGCLLFVAALGVAAGIEWFRDPQPEPTEEASPGRHGDRPVWTVWILSLSPVLVFPVGALVYLTRDVASLLMQAGIALTPSNPQPVIAGMDLSQLSGFVARRLMLGAFGGSIMALLVVGSAIAAVAAHRYSAKSAALDRLSQAVTVAGGVFGIWTLVVLTMDIGSIARAAG